MKKILTISIAAYNMEAFIEKTLDSLIDERVINDLEIFVVDDGGTDGTLNIAKRYASEFPDSIFPVHKENGGYGSTVNYSIQHATGKYFKLLDGDDWFDTESLVSLVGKLSESNSDVILHDYYKYMPNGDRILTNMRCCDKQIPVSSMETPAKHGMWAIVYKTELLIKSKISLPLHMLYTDRIYSTVPLAYAQTVEYYPFPVYCYRLGRDGQSVSRESRIKHLDETLSICKMLCDFYEDKKTEKNENLSVLLNIIARQYSTVFRTLLLLPITKENLKNICDYENQIKNISPDIYTFALKKSRTGKVINIFRKTKYTAYWVFKLLPHNILNFR